MPKIIKKPNYEVRINKRDEIIQDFVKYALEYEIDEKTAKIGPMKTPGEMVKKLKEVSTQLQDI